jgi:hypothetical protein
MWRLLHPCCEGLVLPYVSSRRVWAGAYERSRELDNNLFTPKANIVFVISVVKFVRIVIAIIFVITIVSITSFMLHE